MSYTSEVLADSPLGYWRLGATPTEDSSGNGYTVVQGGTPTATTGLPPSEASDGARIISEDGDWYELGSANKSDFDFAGTASFSLECWLRFDSLLNNVRIFSHEDINNGWALYHHSTNGIGIFRKRSGAFALCDEVPPGFGTGIIYHVVGTYDGSNLRIYVNGTLLGSPLADSTAIAAYTEDVRIGGSSLGTTMRGTLDEVAAYPITLGVDRIMAHYQAGLAQVSDNPPYGFSGRGAGW